MTLAILPAKGEALEPNAQLTWLRASIPCGRALTLGEIARDLAGGLEQLTVPTNWNAKPVSWATVLSDEDAAPSVPRGAMVLMPAQAVPKSSNGQERLAENLTRSGAVALAVEGPLDLKSEAPALIERFQAAGLALFALTPLTSIPDVIGSIYASNGTSEARLLRRSSTIQNGLLEALGKDEPEQAMLNRISKACSTVTAIIGEERVISATGILPDAAIVRYLRDQPPTVQDWQEGTRRIFATPIERSQFERSWLVVVARASDVDHSLIKAVIKMAAPLFTAVARLADVASRQARGARAAILRALIDDSSDLSSEIAHRQAAFHGVGIERGVNVAVITLPFLPGREGVLPPLTVIADGLDDVLDSHGVNRLLLQREKDIVLVTQGKQDIVNATLSDLLRQHSCMHVVVSDLAHDPHAMQRTIREAHIVVRSKRESRIVSPDPMARLCHVEDLTLTALISSSADSDDVRERAARILAPILGNPILKEALDAIFEHCFDVTKASKSLHIHANTMRYRLERIEQSLGGSLHDPLVITDVTLARLAAN